MKRKAIGPCAIAIGPCGIAVGAHGRAIDVVLGVLARMDDRPSKIVFGDPDLENHAKEEFIYGSLGCNQKTHKVETKQLH